MLYILDWDEEKEHINIKKHGIMKSEYNFSKAKRAKKTREIKVLKTFRLDPEVLIWLTDEAKKEGIGYQTFLNSFLLKSMSKSHDLEERVRKLEQIVYKQK
jgi:uncharacterized protein (DUF4415 family)